MRKLTFLFACLFMIGVGLVNAQSLTVQGKVISDEDGQPVIGASVLVKGTTTGTITGTDGSFSITVPVGNRTLVVSYIGMKSVEVPAENGMVVRLQPQTLEIDEVVVTAIGIKRSEKALGYSASAVSSQDITMTGNRSALNALQGKVAGVEITSASGAPGSSTRVIMRGYSSLGGSNQPLYVVDGVPISNGQIGSTSINGGLDFGNRANDINPEDIESMTILKGGSATALYGSRAASGVILITTKKGEGLKNKPKVEVSSTSTFDSPLRLPYFQNEFGQGWYDRGGGEQDLMENGSWGPRFDGKIRPWGFVVDNQQQIKPYVALPTNIKDFFDIGTNYNNTVSVSNGDADKSYYISYGNVTADGIMPTDADYYNRNTVSMRGSAKFLKIFNISGSLNYVRKDMRFTETGQDQAALDGLWQSPRDISIVDLKDYNNKFNNVDNYYTIYAQNPYYILNEHGNKFQENRIFGNISLDAQITPSLSATFRLGDDVANSTLKTWRAITNSARADYNDEVGRVGENAYYSSELNTDFFLNFNPKLNNDFAISVIVGHNFNQRDAQSQGSEVIGLDIPKFYNLSNSSATPSIYGTLSQRRLIGVYGNLDVSFKDMLFLNITGRNDWSSTLPANNRSFFYPSISGSFLFSELIQNKDVLSYGKLRASFARTGKDADPYLIYPVLLQTSITDGYRSLDFPLAGPVNGFTISNVIGNDQLQPEISQDFEIGTNLKLFKNLLDIDFTWYNKKITALIWTATLPSSTGYTSQTQNLGEITNKGVELSLSVTPIRRKNIEWEIFANYSKNNNLLKSLISGLDEIVLGGTGGFPFVARPGYELGLFKGNVPETDPQGRIVVNAQGLPVFKAEQEIIGSSQNKYRLGGGTSLKIKNFRVHAAFDYRNGGKMYSRTAEIAYFTGNAQPTTYNDRQPFIIPNSVQLVGGQYIENTTPIAGFTNNLNLYYNQTYKAGIGDAYALIDKTFFKLRELSISYSFPKSVLKNAFINSVDLSLVGNNLFLWTPDSNLYTDPELTTFGNDLAADYGEFGATPSTRSLGFNIKLSF
ncbi:MAG TPA: SusC/RagA family TonB-linked outer membrane protein [Paludibacteraceae bacterium]|nr:SusC/RagA family TonB-linked outer membrane protein [Paludibacteraceae bacterium]